MLILLPILSACTTTSCNHVVIRRELPNMPIAGGLVAKELEAVCSPYKCPNINNWLNRLYTFKQEYTIYQREER